MPRDYYEVLGVDREAPDDEIKKAFRGLARELHPDINRHDPAAEEKFKEVAEAYEVLSDLERRATYDRYGHDGLRTGGYQPGFEGFGSVSDIFEAFFGGGDLGSIFGGRGRGGPQQGRDVAVRVSISLEEVLTGTSRELEVEVIAPCSHCNGNGAEPGTPIETCPRCEGTGQLQSVARTVFGQVVRTQACDRCHGDGRVAKTPCKQCRGSGYEEQVKKLTVDLPAGIDSGQRVRVSGRGHAGALGGPAGDLYVLVNVEEDRRFERHGDDLITKLDVPFTDAALGGSLAVPTIEGEEEVEVSPGTQPGAILRLRERGLPSLRGRRRGDLHVVMNVLIPSNLDDDQRDLLRRFAESTNGDTYEARPEGLFDRIRQAFRGLIRLAVRCPAERAQGVLAELLEMAPSGVEQIDAPDGLEGVVEYAVYGARGELPELGGLDAVAGAGRIEVRADEVPDDWTERWKRFYFPVLIGGRLYVRPPWEEPAHRGGVEEVVIDPGGAFGTGTHPTTRMSLELLLETDGRGSFCDLGCGSGVLAIAASKLGFEPVLGVDADRAALDETLRNARANGVEVEVRHVDLRREDAPVADAVAANLTAGLCEAVALSWAKRGVRPGTAIVSGFLREEADGVEAALAKAGLEERRRVVGGEWAAILAS